MRDAMRQGTHQDRGLNKAMVKNPGTVEVSNIATDSQTNTPRQATEYLPLAKINQGGSRQKGVYRRMKQIMDLFLTFGRIGAFTFGGGYAMLSLLDYECVEKKKWLTADELMDVTVIAESTPGPIAINCATYTGYKLAGMGGAFFATVGMVLPSFLLLFAVSAFFENMLVVGMIEKAFRGIRIAVSILIIQAAVRMIRKMMKKSPDRKAQIFLVIFFFLAALAMNIAGMHISTVYFIICSGFIGLALFGRPGNKKAGRDDL